MDSSGDGTISGQEFKNGMARMSDCTSFQMLCMLLMSINSIKSLIHNLVPATSTEPCQMSKASDASDWKDEGVSFPDGSGKDIAGEQPKGLISGHCTSFGMHALQATPTERTIRKASDVSDSGYKEVPYPLCLKKDLATLRQELQEMKVDLSSKINNLKLVSSPLEGFHQISSTVDNMPVWVLLSATGERLPTVEERSKTLSGKGTAEVKNPTKQSRTEDLLNAMDTCVESSGMSPTTHDIFVVVNEV